MQRKNFIELNEFFTNTIYYCKLKLKFKKVLVQKFNLMLIRVEEEFQPLEKLDKKSAISFFIDTL